MSFALSLLPVDFASHSRSSCAQYLRSLPQLYCAVFTDLSVYFRARYWRELACVCGCASFLAQERTGPLQWARDGFAKTAISTCKMKREALAF